MNIGAESLYRIGKRFVYEGVEFIGAQAIAKRTARDVFVHLKHPEAHPDLLVRKPLNALQRLWVSVRFRISKTLNWFTQLKPLKLEAATVQDSKQGAEHLAEKMVQSTSSIAAHSTARPDFLPPAVKQKLQDYPTEPLTEIITHNCGPASLIGLFRLFGKEVSLAELQKVAEQVVEKLKTDKKSPLTLEEIQKLGFYSPTGALSDLALATMLEQMGFKIERLNLKKPGQQELLSHYLHDQQFPALFSSPIEGQVENHCTLNLIRNQHLYTMDPMPGHWREAPLANNLPHEGYVTVILKKPTYQAKP